ncbi:hypothetical protein [Paracoccus tibetensis]|uniref:Uncharacterized protein n=1 Tax=Paracoccus tibetensis TaxID=336292 RepID=A0A1G5HD09_9RHOB|nr:hypothetical protein [Paracoccus tibetensis]SCY61752.1 hypothetical protein SAMN05660710_02117 [Paracoccus tibetensis]
MLRVATDDAELQRNLKQLIDKDARRAASWALNDTADDVLKHVQDRMDRVFDRPTRFTNNAFMVWRAKPNSLEAEVMERATVGRRHFLKVQELGGARAQTGLERLMASQLGAGGMIMQAAVPAEGAKLDAYGNWANAERRQAIAAVSGPAATAPAAGAKTRRRAGFFVSKPGSALSPGIWKRAPDGSISKVLHFTAGAPVYGPRLGFMDGASEVYADRLPAHLARTIEKMIERVAAKSR